MCHVAAKVLADDDVPGWAVSAVELLLDLRSDVLLDVVLLERGGRDVDRLLLHLLAHVHVLDDRLGPVPVVLCQRVRARRHVYLVGHRVVRGVSRVVVVVVVVVVVSSNASLVECRQRFVRVCVRLGAVERKTGE